MTEQKITLKRTYALRFALAGIGFGLVFPIVGTLMEISTSQIPFALTNAWHLHSTDPLLWIIDTAPFFLGLFAYFIGLRQDTLLNSNEELHRRELELKSVQNSIEQRIREQTHDLFENSKILERRTTQLETVSSVARSIVAVQVIEQLLPSICRVVSERFGYYHTGIFLFDERAEYTVLQASNSEGGQRMLARGHRLRAGTTGIVGFVAGQGEPRVVQDVGADSVYFNNPDLPNTRSELALPLKVANRTIGVLDMQSEELGAFKEEDIAVLGILANQISVAIENARLFTQTRQALQDSQAVYQQYVKRDWAHYSRELEFFGYSYDGIRTSPITAAPPNPTSHELSIPVKIRGLVIGNVIVRSSNPLRQWAQGEVSLIQAAADRAGLAIENIRLLTEAQRRAAKEHTISEITSRIGTSVNINSILQTAVEELGRILPSSEVILQFQGQDAPAHPADRPGRETE